MQDQGRRLLIAVALALGVLFLWGRLVPKEEPPPASGSGSQVVPKPSLPAVGVPAGVSAAPAAALTAGSGAPAPAAAPTAGSGAPAPASPAPAGQPVAEVPRPPEQTIALPFENFVATFSSYCGGLTSWQLTDKRYEHDETRGQLLPVRTKMTILDPSGKVVSVPAAELTDLPDCGAFDVNFASSTFVIPRHAVWKGEQRGKTEVRYTYSSDQLEIVKTFTVLPDQFLVRMIAQVSVHVPEGTEAHQQLAVSVYGFQDPAATKKYGLFEGITKNGLGRGITDWLRAPRRAWASSTLRDDTIYQTDIDGVLDWPRFEPTIVWTGFEQPYLLEGYAPRLREGERVEKHTRASDGTKGQPRGFLQTDLLFPMATFKHGDAPLTKEIVGYLGPKNYDDLQEADAAAGFTTGFNKTIDLGWFAFIGRPLLWLLQKFHEVVGNWGLAIILLTFLVKGLTLYWTTKSMRSMKAMAALAPQMKALQAKYADDKQRQQAETMALYKQHNVNPVAGCLPILLQMPIWLALYRMLSSAGELYQRPFILGWIDDLTAPDPFHILPVVLVVTMFVQARLQPASVDSAQQKLLQYGMPLMFGVMSFVFPAGLTIYIFTNTVLSAFHSIYMNKFDKQSLAIAARMKKNQEQAAAAATSGAAKTAANALNGAAKAKRVIDAKATEVGPDDQADDDADTDDASEDTAGPASSPGSPGSGPARNRPRRKKRRR